MTTVRSLLQDLVHSRLLDFEKKIVHTGIPRFTLLMWGNIKNRGKRKLRKSRLLSSTKGKENRIE